MRQLLISLFLLCSGSFLLGQTTTNYLALENARKFKRIRYELGDEIRFKMEKDGATYQGRIVELTDSVLILQKAVLVQDEKGQGVQYFQDQLHIDDIAAVYKRRDDNSYKEYFLPVLGGGLLAGGLVLLGFTGINRLAVSDDVRMESVYIASGLALTGGSLLLLRKKKVKIGKRWVLKVMEDVE